MSRANKAGQSIAAHINRRHQVEPEQGKVGQVVLREPFSGKVRVQAAKPAKASLAHAHAFQIGQDYAARVAYDDIFDVAASIDEHAYLPVDFVRSFGHLARKFLRDDLARRDAAVIKLFEALNLVVL